MSLNEVNLSKEKATEAIKKVITSNDLPKARFLISVGNHRLATYKEFCEKTHSKLIFSKPMFSGLFKIFSFLAASEIGIIEVSPNENSPKEIYELSEWGNIFLLCLEDEKKIQFVIDFFNNSKNLPDFYESLLAINTNYLFVDINSEEDETNLSIKECGFNFSIT